MKETGSVGRYLAAKQRLLNFLDLKDSELDMLVGIKAYDSEHLADLNALLREYDIDVQRLVGEIHELAPETLETIVYDGHNLVTLPEPEARLVRDGNMFTFVGSKPTLFGYTRATVGLILKAIGRVLDGHIPRCA